MQTHVKTRTFKDHQLLLKKIAASSLQRGEVQWLQQIHEDNACAYIYSLYMHYIYSICMYRNIYIQYRYIKKGC